MSTGKVIAARQAVEFCQTRRCVGVREQGMHTARWHRGHFGNSKVTDKQFLAIRPKTIVNGFAGRISDQRRQEDTGIQIGTQPKSGS